MLRSLRFMYYVCTMTLIFNHLSMTINVLANNEIVSLILSYGELSEGKKNSPVFLLIGVLTFIIMSVSEIDNWVSNVRNLLKSECQCHYFRFLVSTFGGECPMSIFQNCKCPVSPFTPSTPIVQATSERFVNYILTLYFTCF